MQIEERILELEEQVKHLQALSAQRFTADGYVRYERVPQLVGDGITHLAGAQEVDVDAEGIGGVPDSRTIGNGTGITGGGDLSADRTLSQVAKSVNQLVEVLDDGSSVGTRAALNLPTPENATWTLTDDSGNDRVNADLEVNLDRWEYRGPTTASAVDLTSAATTTVLNVTETGFLIGVGIVISGYSASGGGMNVYLGVTTDGGTRRTHQLAFADNKFGRLVDPYVTKRGKAADTTQSGDTVGDSFYFPIGLPYDTSCVVDIERVISPSSPSGTWDAAVTVARGVLV